MNPYASLQISMPESQSKTKALIRKAFITLYAQKSVYRITIKELCDAVPIARTTFYTYYQNINELQEEIENIMIAGIAVTCAPFMNTPCKDENDLVFFDDTVRFIWQNEDIFRAFLIQQPNMRFIEKWKNAIKYHFWERLFHNYSYINSGLILETIASVAVSSFSYWLEHPDDIDISQGKKILLTGLKAIDYSE